MHPKPIRHLIPQQFPPALCHTAPFRLHLLLSIAAARANGARYFAAELEKWLRADLRGSAR